MYKQFVNSQTSPPTAKMPAIADLIGESVLNGKGESVPTSDFASDGKVVGLYFSAHWCPPCRGFTPNLAKFYTDFKATEKGSTLEMVFVSSDKDEASFKQYFEEMPWHAVPFSDRDRKNKLSKKFKVQGIPSLVFVDGATAKLITSDGRTHVTEDPEGKDFPWAPQPLSEILKGSLKSNDKDEPIDMEAAFAGKVRAFYFSAHWCPPCRGFTPQLVKTYNTLKAAGKNIEMVFASSDRDEESFNDYFKTMPWLALPHGDDRIGKLKKHFGISGIPSLIILDENNDVITTNGRAAVSSDPEGKEFPWQPKPLQELTENVAGDLNESACVIVFTDKEEALVTQAKDLLQSLAEAEQAAATHSGADPIRFFYEGTSDDDIAQSVRDFAKLGDKKPLLVVLDIPSEKKYIHADTNLTKESVAEVVAKLKAETLEMKPVRV